LEIDTTLVRMIVLREAHGPIHCQSPALGEQQRVQWFDIFDSFNPFNALSFDSFNCRSVFL
jgi:hypothetical protein